MGKMTFIEIAILSVEHVTEKAALCIIDDGTNRSLWIPLSVMATKSADSISEDDEDFVILVHDWYARKEGLD